MNGTVEFYSENINRLQREISAIHKKQSAIYWVRLVSFLAFAACIGYGIYAGIFVVGLISVPFFLVFSYAIYKDSKLSLQKQFLSAKVAVNQKELDCLAYSYTSFHDGKEYSHINPGLVADFQLFGKGSLYQFISRCNTTLGRKKLAQTLVQPEFDISTIKSKQIAVQELASTIQFRQDFQAHGTNIQETGNELDRLQQWIQQPSAPIKKLILLALFTATVNIAAIVLVIMGSAKLTIIGIAIAIGLTAVYSQKKLVDQAHNALGKTSALFLKYSALFKLIEDQRFHSNVLSSIKQEIAHDNTKASGEILRLQKILNRFDLRYNVVISILINAYTGFDLLVMVSLERWKIANAEYITQWFSALAEFDSLQSFGTLAFNSGDGWSFPDATDEEFCIEGAAMGHPLIDPAERICNTFGMQGSPAVSIITGANMAGKSTFLRTVACNIVLAMNGAPVCAERFRFSPVEILSSIKIEDSLLRHESYFYAELNRLKSIIDHIGNQQKCLVILDEIMRGTNSKDKQVGTRGLLEKLIALNASVIIATHDLSIGEMEQQYPQSVANYCFEVELNGNELYFDYSLKPGISTKLNASFLMQKMGIV